MSDRLHIISLDIHHLSFNESLNCVINLALERKSAYLCFANAHMTIEAYKNKDFQDQVNKADLILADGKPIAFACKLLHRKNQERISGMEFISRILERANEKRLSVFIYGTSDEVIKAAKSKIHAAYPGVHFAGAISPPFRQLTDEEINNDIIKINQSGARLVFVALGCPKQEKWMAVYSARISSVLLGLGGALPVFAGFQSRAPQWMQNLALEWLYRLAQQPLKLFARYFYTNSYFLLLLCRIWFKKFSIK